MSGYTYILRCADGTLYCGWTSDLTARLAAHNSGKGAKYTRGRGPVTLVYSELFDTQSEAMRREAEIKKLTRVQKQALIDTQSGAELLTIYDADGRPCGARPRAVVHTQGLFHHVCHLWVAGVRDGVPGLWLQQRQFDRPLYPGGFDLASTGHIDPGETPEEAARRELKEETGLDLVEIRHVMPPAYSAVLHLHYYEGYSLREIARLLGVTVPTVKMRLKRGRDALRSTWEEHL